MAKHFIASLLSGDPSSIIAVEKALKGTDLTVADVLHCADKIKERANSHKDEYAVETFASGSNARDLVTYATTQYIIDRIDDQGITGRAIEKTGEDKYIGEDEDGNMANLVGDYDGRR